MAESKIQASIKRLMQKKGYRVIKVIQLSENGYPDLMCLKNGQVVWIEVKDTGNEPEPLQYERIEQLKKMGFIAFWTDDLDTINLYIK